MVSPLFGFELRLTEIEGGVPRTACRRAGQIGADTGELEAERRAGNVFADRYRRAYGCRNDQTAEAVGALIGLQAFGDHLRETGLRAVAVEDIRSAGNRRLVHRAAGEDVIIADLGIEQRQI